ncbi:hypothetical protein CCUS01_14445 [Colletotrichum cuscutae]|uniref:Uncharacterized protein n=1 Tax=Colletotrichum cuscutae TaxID=1209917 RepID=A0AAJ0DLF3_9PEZI|nr:hypothetical protein CCUS01_14445 [Colletotrichum cuscutae]
MADWAFISCSIHSPERRGASFFIVAFTLHPVFSQENCVRRLHYQIKRKIVGYDSAGPHPRQIMHRFDAGELDSFGHHQNLDNFFRDLVRKTGCTATHGQNIHAAARLARLWCGGVSGPSLIPASRFFKPQDIVGFPLEGGGWNSRDAIGGTIGGGISCPQQSLFSRVDLIDSPSGWGSRTIRRHSTTLREFIRHAAFQRTTAPNGIWRFLESGTLILGTFVLFATSLTSNSSLYGVLRSSALLTIQSLFAGSERLADANVFTSNCQAKMDRINNDRPMSGEARVLYYDAGLIISPLFLSILCKLCAIYVLYRRYFSRRLSNAILDQAAPRDVDVICSSDIYPSFHSDDLTNPPPEMIFGKEDIRIPSNPTPWMKFKYDQSARHRSSFQSSNAGNLDDRCPPYATEPAWKATFWNTGNERGRNCLCRRPTEIAGVMAMHGSNMHTGDEAFFFLFPFMICTRKGFGIPPTLTPDSGHWKRDVITDDLLRIDFLVAAIYEAESGLVNQQILINYFFCSNVQGGNSGKREIGIKIGPWRPRAMDEDKDSQPGMG